MLSSKYLNNILGPLALIALAGCAQQAVPTPRPADAAIMASPLKSRAPGADDHNAAHIPGARLPAPAASYGAELLAPATAMPALHLPDGGVSLDFADTDIRAVIAQILGGILHVTYTIDPRVTGKATLHTAQPLPPADLIPTLQTLLAENNAELVADHDVYRVIPAGTTDAALAGDIGSGGQSLGGSSIVDLNYVSAPQLAQILQPYVGKDARVVASPDGHALIVDGSPASRNTLIDLIHAFDVDTLVGQSYALFPVGGETAEEFASAFSAALQANRNTSTLRVIALARIGAVMVIAPSTGQIAQANRVYGVLEREARASLQSWHVYYLHNSRANDAARVLQLAFTPNDVTAAASPEPTGQTAPGITAQTLATPGASSGSPSGFGGSSENSGMPTGGQSASLAGLGASTASAPQAAQPTPQPSSNAGDNPLLGSLGGSGNAATSGGDQSSGDGTRIIADEQQDAVLVYATAAEDAQIHAILRKIDIEPLEVEIDATIAEVTLNSALQYGTQFFFKSGGINGVLSQGTTSSLVQNFPGFVLSGYGADAAPLAISALQSVTKVRVLSSPQLLVQNDRTANLLVGNLVPYLSQTAQSTLTAGAPVINSINYQETGVILQITPRISDEGMVSLTVSQQVSSVAPTITTQGINSPTFTERSVSSSVIVHDGQTIGLAGLITDTDNRSNAGLPYLKNIPLLGALFGNQNNSRARTELLVLITPHVVHDQNDAAALAKDLREELPNASAVPAVLNAYPPGGSADPNAQLGMDR